MKKSPLLLSLFLVSVSLWGQIGEASRRSGDFYFEHQRYEQALAAYLPIVEDTPDDFDLRYRIGRCYYELNDLSMALKSFDFILDQDRDPEPVVRLYRARTLHQQLDFSEAISAYKTFLREVGRSHPQRAEVKDRIRRCGVGLQMKSQQRKVLVENLGEKVNSSGDDFRPLFSPNVDNRIYFSSSRKGVVGGLRGPDGKPDELDGTYCSDMFATSMQDGQWQQADPLSYLLNSPRFDVIQDFSKDGKRLYYFKGFTLHSGDIHVDTFKVRPEERSLVSDYFVGPMRSWQGDCDLFFFKDTIALFASRRAGGYGGLDLYISVFSNGVWGAAENLGPTINSAYDERSPFLARDGRTLYFSSNNSRSSLGGYDLFKAQYLEKEEGWGPTQNLGVPFNSAADDMHIRLSRDGLIAYFSSDRKEGMGGADLYRAFLREKEVAQLRSSRPTIFLEVPAYNRVYGTDRSNRDETDMEEYVIDPLFYDEQGEVLTGRNLRTLQVVGRVLKEHPEVQLYMTSHSDGSDPERVDLFFSINRAERVAEHLIANGVNPAQLHLQAVGSAYPLAAPLLQGRPNPSGDRLNRRLDLTFGSLDEASVRVLTKAPVVNEAMQDDAWAAFQSTRAGLSYKVQVVATPQMYYGPLLERYPHQMVEKEPGEETYRYTVGLYKTYNSVRQLKRDLERQGGDGVLIIAYIDGQRIPVSSLSNYVETYPDLSNFLDQ
jgi:outer membrane protein OmpA-like peptidoglycan-associated protein